MATILEKEEIDLITESLARDNENMKDWIQYLEKHKEDRFIISRLKQRTEKVSEIIEKLK